MKTLGSISLTLLLVLGLSSYTYSIQPDKNYILTPDSVNWAYEELKIITPDNFELNTWVYHPHAETNKNTILILAYPDAGNMSYWVYFAHKLARSGYTVVTFDYRGFGKSSDFEINPKNLYYTEFSNDLTSVVLEMSERFSDERLGIWSLSMGTVVTSRAYPYIKKEIDFIVGEGFVANTSDIVDRYREQAKYLILPEPSDDYIKSVSSITSPTLIFAASKDEITTTKDALELKEKIGGVCTIIEYEGEHLRGFQYQIASKGFGGWYVEQINSFIARI